MSIKTELIEYDQNLETNKKQQQQQQQHKKHENLIQILDLFNSKYYCKICRHKLRTKADELIHLNYKHNKLKSNDINKYKCLFCENEFNTYFSLKKHLMIKHLNEKPYSCRLCLNTKQYTQFIYLKTHIKKYHSNALNNIHLIIDYKNSTITPTTAAAAAQCELVPPSSIQKSLLITTTTTTTSKIYSSNEPFICQINMKLNCLKCKLCSKICLTESNYLVHKWEHLINNNKNYLICWQCKTLKFDTYYDLETHLHSVHINELSYECDFCKKLFYDWNLIKQHLNKIHFQITGLKFCCVYCKNLFNTHKDIVFHILRSHNTGSYLNYEFKCSLCDDKFRNKISLNLHLKQHEFIMNTKRNVVVGTIQGKTNGVGNGNGSAAVTVIQQQPVIVKPATALSPVVTTITTRRNASSLICQLCGYTFENTFFLNQHKSLHLSDNLKRPHKCHLCQVTFSKTEQLLRHMIVHQANELDFVCKICFSTFSRKQDLDRHLNFHSR